MASKRDDDNVPARKPEGEARVSSARGTARLAAVQALYQMDVARTNARNVIDEFIRHRFLDEADRAHYDKADVGFFEDLVLGAVREQRKIDPLVAQHLAEGWKLSRIDSILRAILRSAGYELEMRRDVPARVIINEYVEIAHAFFGGDEPRVVNGILDSIARALRAGEVKDRAHG